MKNFTSVTKQYYMGNFDSYIIVENGKTSTVPLATDNSDYQAIQDWIAEGNSVIDNGGV